MAREPIVLTCPLCLDVDDPESMVRVPIQRTNPPDSVVIAICRRCVGAIAKAFAAADEAAPPLASSVEPGRDESSKVDESKV